MSHKRGQYTKVSSEVKKQEAEYLRANHIGDKRYVSNIPCARGHELPIERYTVNMQCVECTGSKRMTELEREADREHRAKEETYGTLGVHKLVMRVDR